MEDAAAMLMVERAREGTLGRRLAQGRILGRIEPLPPLGVGQAERKIAGPGVRAAVAAGQGQSHAGHHRDAAEGEEGASVDVHGAAPAPPDLNRARTRSRSALPIRNPPARSSTRKSASFA